MKLLWTLALLMAIGLLSPLSQAQAPGATLRGQVTDPSGAAIPGAAVTLSNAQGVVKTASTDEAGRYVLAGVAPGTYTLRVTSAGFEPYENASVELSARRPAILDVKLEVLGVKQELTVTDTPKVDVEPTSNVGALVLKGKDIEALSEDPEDLAADLQALAGPAAGPNGGQIYIDGFTGGRLPPRESIREIRINQNPFSAEFDRLGFGRIEILTRPGTDKFRGQSSFSYGNAALNSRNPYAPNRADFEQRHFGGNLSGPISKKSSFFLDVERREIDDNAIIHATILDSSLNATPFSQAVTTPMRRTSVSQRVDYQLTPNHTLMARYNFSYMNDSKQGIGEFSLAERAYSVSNGEHTLRLSETAVLGPKAINETRFQYERSRNSRTGDNSKAAIVVQDAFAGGSSQVGQAFTNQDEYELQNYVFAGVRTHALKAGVRVRGVQESTRSPQNFGGTFTFAGGVAPQLDANSQPLLDADGRPVNVQITSLERYRRTLLFQQQGLAPAQIRALGGGASQFSIIGGNPLAGVGQYDLGLFFQDDWRVRRNVSLSLGLRYETQNNISDHRDFAPRVGFAWGLGGGQSRVPKTVIRGGFGIFYDRFSEELTLQAIRLDGVRQQQYIVPSPDFYPNVPPAVTLEANRIPQTVRRVYAGLRSPYVVQEAIGLERQLPKNISLAVTFTNSRGVHVLRSRNINAPLPGTYDARNPASGVRPFGNIGNIYQFESSGIFKQRQLITNLSARVSPGLTLFGFYMVGSARSNADGVGSFPADNYDLSTEFGRASFDSRHRGFIGGSVVGPWGLRFSPFITMNSGRPLNITVGRDLNGDSLFNDRPAFATDLSRPGVVRTRFGDFDPNPIPGQAIIPRNYGAGPGQFTVNLRLSKTIGFGERPGAAMAGAGGAGGRRGEGGGMAQVAMRGGGGPQHGPGGGGGGGGGGMPRGGGGPMGGMFSEGMTNKRYNLTFTISARNLLNHVNPGQPVGNLSSPLFGQSTQLGQMFGPGGGGAGNRRVELQMRFNF